MMYAQPPPENHAPIVRIDPSSYSEVYKDNPSFERGGQRIIVTRLYVDGDPALLEAIKSKVIAEGWDAYTVTPPNRPLLLGIKTDKKSLEQVISLNERLARGELGNVVVNPGLAPVPIAATRPK